MSYRVNTNPLMDIFTRGGGELLLLYSFTIKKKKLFLIFPGMRPSNHSLSESPYSEDHFGFNHGCLATNHNGVNIIIICYNFALSITRQPKDER